jgi:predicted metal-dependent phosphotriesterase family hydrolase
MNNTKIQLEVIIMSKKDDIERGRRAFKTVKNHMTADGNYKALDTIVVTLLKEKGIDQEKIDKRLSK